MSYQINGTTIFDYRDIGLKIGSGKYLWIDKAAGSPSSDCTSGGHAGRMVLDTTNNRLYICNGAARGWDYIGLTD